MAEQYDFGLEHVLIESPNVKLTLMNGDERCYSCFIGTTSYSLDWYDEDIHNQVVFSCDVLDPKMYAAIISWPYSKYIIEPMMTWTNIETDKKEMVAAPAMVFRHLKVSHVTDDKDPTQWIFVLRNEEF